MSLVVINQDAVIDHESHSVVIQFDRVTLSMAVEEFLDFYNTIADIKDFLTSSPDYVVGLETDVDTEETKSVIIPKPDEDDYT
tara:strand:- start:337 stop:585 length:249 start_codon:yes stop_codon:yes gene_type:complete